VSGRCAAPLTASTHPTPRTRFAKNLIGTTTENQPHRVHTDSGSPEPQWAAIVPASAIAGHHYAHGELFLTDLGILLPSQSGTVNLLDGAQRHAVMAIKAKRARGGPLPAYPLKRISLVFFHAPDTKTVAYTDLLPGFPDGEDYE